MAYGYDTASELTSLTYTLGGTTLGDLSYTYDQVGRRTAVGGSWARTGLPSALASATYDAANEIVTRAGISFTYDANGNLTDDGATTYTWNARNQLTTLSGGASASFMYDGVGRRRGKTVSGATTNFLYDGVNTVQELAGGVPSANLLTGLDLDATFARAEASGVSTLLADALGSTVALADESGAVQTQYTFDPFGATSVSGAPSANVREYTGRENDETGLYGLRARYYSPQLQRFISEDPLGANGGVNLFAYAANAPTQFIDLLGLKPKPGYGPGPGGKNPNAPPGGGPGPGAPPGGGPGPGPGDGPSPRNDDPPWYDPFKKELEDGGCGLVFLDGFGEGPFTDAGPSTSPDAVISTGGAMVAGQYVVERGLVVPLRSSIYREILGVTELASTTALGVDIAFRLANGIDAEIRAYRNGSCR